MRAAPSLLLVALLPLFAGCQVLAEKPQAAVAGTTRMQGELSAKDGQLLFKPCGESRHFAIFDAGNTGLLQEAAALAAEPGTLFADVSGNLSASQKAGNDGQLNVQRLYRVEHSDSACSDPNFKRLTLRAYGHEPDWSLKASGKGMILDRPGQPSLAVPYLEEQLPDGRFSINTEANGQRVELWVAPQRCVDVATGGVQHLSAELRLNGQLMRGCAYYGGSRND
ncbi:COG3650 family protein [Pseudomonas sp. NPDC090755]|uniref:COG3650 family protein n=1 Tax=Pseudomonas sp. NPDC090755 TaxID=3364481 RepID=UPI00383B6AAF